MPTRTKPKPPEEAPAPDPIEAAFAAYREAHANADEKIAIANALREKESQEAAAAQAELDRAEQERLEAERVEREAQEAKAAKKRKAEKEAAEAEHRAKQAELVYLRAKVEGSEGARSLLDRAAAAHAERPPDEDIAGRAALKVREVLGVEVPPDLFQVIEPGRSVGLDLLGEKLVAAADDFGGFTLWLNAMRPDNYGEPHLVAQVPFDTISDVHEARVRHALPDLFQRGGGDDGE